MLCRCFRESPLERIKQELWREAQDFPLFHLLQQEPTSYIFVSITQDAEREEFYDETRRLCDLRLFQPLLKLVEPAGNKEEKMLNYDIGIALGLPVHELDEVMARDPEVMEFRKNIMSVCKAAVEERDKDGKESQALYAFPPEIAATSQLPRSLEEKLDKDTIIISIWQLSPSCEKQKYTVAVNHHDTPLQVIREAIYKSIRNSADFRNDEDKRRVVKQFQSQYLLKVRLPTGWDTVPVCRWRAVTSISWQTARSRSTRQTTVIALAVNHSPASTVLVAGATMQLVGSICSVSS